MREYETPRPVEVTANKQPLTHDSLEADTAVVAGTRKLMAVMFWLLKIDVPDDEAIGKYIDQVSKDSEV